MGGIDGSLLAFQEARFDKGRSSIFLYNMEFDTRSNPGPKVNSKAWEYWPTVSGDWLLFFRTNAKDTRRRAFLYNTTTQERRLLDLSKGKARLLGGGQVNGDWAAWMKCGKTCNVFRYDIMGDAKEKVPNPGAKYQYGAAVDPDGTVYYGRSGPHCGQHVKIWKYPVGGSPVRLLVFPKRHDFGRAFVYRTGSENHYSFDYTRCRDQSSDIYEIVDNLA
jgi:Tol biopolymer transport system component